MGRRRKARTRASFPGTARPWSGPPLPQPGLHVQLPERPVPGWPRPGPGPGCSWSAAPPGGHAVRRARLPGGHRGQRQVGAPSGGAGRARRGPALTQRTASAAPGHSITECPRTPLSGPRAVLAAGSKFSRIFP